MATHILHNTRDSWITLNKDIVLEDSIDTHMLGVHVSGIYHDFLLTGKAHLSYLIKLCQKAAFLRR